MTAPLASVPRKHVLLLGATGTIGRAVAQALVDDGHAVTALLRPGAGATTLPAALSLHRAEVTDPGLFDRLLAQGPRVDAILSCMASRTGAPQEAWAIDHDAHLAMLRAAQNAGVPQIIQLSAICVQKPRLAFQQAKLAYEKQLMASGLTYSIIRPTAYFKSLSGQVGRLRAGKPFLLFGTGELTACKPISDRDLARFLVACLQKPAQQNAILPIGGPGPALTPRGQGAALFAALGIEPRFRHVPLALMDAIIMGLSAAGHLSQRVRDKAELARIGRYYATESMLVWDPQAQRYDAEATPEFGSDRLETFYARLARGEAEADLGAHAVF